MSGAWSGPSGDAIAIVGADCRYPDAENPDRLWETVLARRRAFRPIPHRRLNLHDYADADPGDGGGAPDPDRTYARFAAVLAGWRFDRARFRVPGPAYRVTDTAHWLALDVAANALVSAGYPDARGLDRDRTGVVIGNTMTGEFSRAAALRLRWPYVRRVLGAALAGQGWQADRLADFLGQVEKAYKEPFPAPNDESLAGGLANTIAGRICNHFGLRGGGHTVDGACSSSLLAIITACSTLLAGDADIMLAGGVDVSLDPFELVGFARTGALATSDMRVYDAAPTGFWPGEGCGVVVLMRAEDAIARGRTPLGLIRGWGISSDGKGGITRPDLGGELLALERAYERAGFGPETVSMFEGHGTGTAVGDETEISALIAAQRDRRTLPPAALGSIKANIGHTKAAAGVAGLLKAALALRHQVLPPTTGCAVPHELLRGDRVPLRIVRAAEPWPAAPLRAAVSAMGFGGINSHVVLEAATRRTRTVLSAGERRTARRPLSHELFVFGGDTTAELVERLARVADAADVISMAEHADLAADLAAKVAARMAARAAAGPGGPLPFRVGIAARDPAQLARYARKAANDLARLARSAEGELIVAPGTFAARGRAGRVGLLFTGQGAPVPATAGALGSVVTDAEDYFRRGRHGRSAQADPVDTAAAQPAIFNASMAGLRCLSRLGVEASVAAGHSVGEITALCWAGALSEGDAYRLVAKRGQIMSQTGRDGTGMAAIAAPPEVVADLIEGTDVVIAADNGASQVVAGDLTEIDRVLELAKERGHGARRLQVSHAFHSPAMRGAVRPLARYLDGVPFEAIGRRVHSTITGRLISAADDLSRMLADQISSPVLFRAAVAGLADECDLLVEVGPGHGLAGLVPGITDVPAVALNAGGASAEDLCLAAAALYATGAMTDVEPWFAERFHRPFELSRDPEFLESPCEQGTASPAGPAAGPAVISAWHGATGDVTDGGNGAGMPGARHAGDTHTRSPADRAPTDPEPADPASAVRGLLADALELPAAAIGDEDRLLSDLHLNSLRVAQLVGNAATACGRAIPAEPLSLSDVSVGDLVVMVDALPPSTAEHDETLVPPGVADWHRILVPETRPMEPAATGRRYAWRVFGSGPLREAVAALLSQPSRPDNRPVPSAVLVFLPEDPDDADIDVLLEAAHDAVRHRRLLAVVDHGDTASGFLGTIRQEHPELEVHWIRTMAPHRPEGVTRALRALPDLPPEIVVDERGRSCTVAHAPPPRAAAQKSAQKSAGTSVAAAPRHALGPDDVVLVTGGGKGIGFETALALGRRTGARVALLGRSRQDADSELRANLARLRDSGLAFAYETADVTDAAEVNGALRAITRSLGSVTALVHASGINRPGRFDDLDREAYAEHAAPKVHGLSTVIGALDAAALRVVVTYGSVIGRFGLTGEAHYALANGRLRERTRLLARDLPGCWVCNVDWTAWAEAGMGERLDVIDRLVRAGVVPVPVGRGVELLMELLDTRPGTGTVLATGRLPGLGDPPTPAGHRFIERIHTLVPGVELVAEAELGERDDRYLADHQIDGIPVLPAVCMLEAMAQAAHVLTRRSAAGIEDARFHRPISVPPGGSRTMRICALVRNDGDVDVVLRSDENGYTADHCGGRVVWDGADPPEVPARRSPLPKHDGSGLYGPLFFHGPVFRRLRRYEHLEATGCTAVLASGPPQLGESPLVLGDVARNDATIHVLQACVPHRRLLPVDCGAFRLHTPAAMDGDGGCGDLVVAAVERSHIAADYTYDVVVRDAAGRAVLSWVGLRLRDVGPLSAATGRSAVLLGPYLQRAITALLPRSSLQAQITAMPPGAERTDRRGAAGRYTANGRPDGVAEAGDRSHLDDLVLSVRGAGPLACDWEWVGDDIDALRAVIPWTSHANELRALTGEPDGHILTRLWTVRECLSKIGRTRNGPLTIDGVYEEGWVLLRAGSEQVVSTVIDIGGDPAPGELGDTAARAAAIAVLIKIGGSMTATPPPRDES